MSEHQRPSLASVVTRSTALPDRIALYGPPGWGKTSFAARLPKPIMLMTPGEDRLIKLIEQGLVPETPHFPDLAQSWDDVQFALRELLTQPHDYRTFILDTGRGVERFAHEVVCQDDFKGDWGEYGFQSFGKGEKIAADRLWVPFLAQLDRLRSERKMRVVLLFHAGILSVKNPEGADYDKILPDLSKRAWSYTSRWADMILCGAFDVAAQKENPRNKIERVKAKGGRARLLHTSPSAAYEAKNVHRLPPTIRLGDDPLRAYDLFRAAFPKPVPAAVPADPPVEAPPAA